MRYRKPEELKETDVEWIKEIPLKWNTVKLKWIGQIHNGSTPKSEIAEYWKGDINWATPEDLSSRNKYLTSSKRNISEKGLRNCGATLVPKGSIILSTRAPIGYTTIAGADFTTNQGCKSIVVDESSSNSEYIYYNIVAAEKVLQSLGSGSTFTELSTTELSNFQIPLPAKFEQRSIAAFLDRKTKALDSLIQKKEQLIERLKEKRQALITRAVTKGLDDDVPMKDSGIEWIGEIPEEWNLVKLKFLTSKAANAVRTGPFGSQLKSDEMIQTGGYKVYNQRNVIDENCQKGNYYISGEKYEELKGFEVEANDFLVTSRGTIGKTYIVPENAPKGVLHPCLIRVRLDKDKIDNQYLDLLLSQTDILLEQLKVLSNGTTIEVIYSNSLKEVMIPVPNRAEQKRILKKCINTRDQINSIIDQAVTQVKKFKEYRQSLISAAVTGKIDVREEMAKEAVQKKHFDIEDIMPLVMYFIDECHRRQQFLGRIKAVKYYYLIHNILELSGLPVKFERLPKGPHDKEFWKRVEHAMRDANWIEIEQEKGKAGKVHYNPNRSVNYKENLENTFGDKVGIVKKIVKELSTKDSINAEILATVYAAWNDLLILGKEATEDNILYQILNRWPGDEKKKISKLKWKRGIRKLKKLGIEPKGFGEPTTKQPELL